MAGIEGINAASGASNQIPAGGNTATTRNDFLKLLVAQLSHQDPLAPQDGSAFVTQLSQLAQTEQSENQTAILQKIQGQLVASAGGQAVSLVGREVTARFSSITLDGQSGSPLQFTLDKDAASATLIIRDAKGNLVRTMRTAPLKGGVQVQLWDGKNDSGLPLPAGSYQLAVSAVDGAGAPVGARTEVKGTVTGVAFDAGQPELLVGATRVKLGDVAQVSNASK
jgi:flagellar basal-body rod modification protein FlgD